MLEVYFDESGNTGSLSLDKSGNRNYETQPFFSYGAYVVSDTDKQNIKDSYQLFLDRFESLQRNGEIKGNILLTRDANEALEYFIEHFVDSNMFINIYNKDYYFATLFCLMIYGQEFQLNNPNVFYNDAEHYYSFPSLILNFIQYLISEEKSDLDKTVCVALESLRKMQHNTDSLKAIFEDIIKDKKVYHFPEFRAVTKNYDKRLVNVVNIPCFGELNNLIMQKFDISDVERVQIDKISLIDEEIKQIFEAVYKKKLDVIENEDTKVFLDIADNIASLFLKLYSRILEQVKDIDATKVEVTWEMKIFERIVSKIGLSNIKLTVPKTDYAKVLACYEMTMQNSPERYNEFLELQKKRWECLNIIGAENTKKTLESFKETP